MATLLELAAEIVSSHASVTSMSTEELLIEIQKVHAALKSIEAGTEVVVEEVEEAKPALTVKEAFKKNEVICMVCGKGGFKTLATTPQTGARAEAWRIQKTVWHSKQAAACGQELFTGQKRNGSGERVV